MAHRGGPAQGRSVHATNSTPDLQGSGAADTLGYPDRLRFRSCLTLFALAAPPKEELFARALAKYFDGRRDRKTLNLLGLD